MKKTVLGHQLDLPLHTAKVKGTEPAGPGVVVEGDGNVWQQVGVTLPVTSLRWW